MAWDSATTPRQRWFVSAWWRWLPSPGSSAQTAPSPPPPSWRAAASPTSLQPATADATARSGKPSPKQAKYEEQICSPSASCWQSGSLPSHESHDNVTSNTKSTLNVSLSLDYWAVRERAAERSEASRSGDCGWGARDLETEKHVGKVSLSPILWRESWSSPWYFKEHFKILENLLHVK